MEFGRAVEFRVTAAVRSLRKLLHRCAEQSLAQEDDQILKLRFA